MNWVTCTLASSRQVKLFNLALVKAIEDRATAGVSVLEFIDGTRVPVIGSAADIFNNVTVLTTGVSV